MTAKATHRVPLAREQIIERALAIVDSDGAESLTMRRLGQALGVDPMAVYHHLPNKTAVLDGIVELLWDGVRLPPTKPDERWQERPLAAVVLKSGGQATPDDLRKFLSDKVARWWLPERWVFIDQVPRTSVGKYDKKTIRARYAEGQYEVITVD